jgi:hypothetical protein
LIVSVPCILSILVYIDSASQVKSFMVFGRFFSVWRSCRKCEVFLM